MLSASSAVPPDWAKFIGPGNLAIGHDVATTDKKTSNPSGLTVMEQLGSMYFQRLVVRWKTPDPDIAIAIISSVFEAMPRNQIRGMAIDASNEKYHAQNLRTLFRKYCPVDLIVSGSAIDFGHGMEKQRFTYKTLLGDLYVSAFDDGCMALPPGNFIITDHRLVKKQNGGYTTDVDEGGNHGDTFDSGKLAYWKLFKGGGIVRAHAATVGSSGKKPSRPGLIGPVGRSFSSALTKLNS